jgi:uncharacterized phage infection (PIP) family protein YhgE
MEIKERNIVAIYLLSIVTLGIYAIYWIVQTKEEMNGLGGEIPTSWLLIVPIAHYYYLYKYCEAFSERVKKDNNAVLWFLLSVFVGIIMPAIVQSELNKIARSRMAAIV